jgi:uncharacterized protein (TIGR03545 family)
VVAVIGGQFAAGLAVRTMAMRCGAQMFGVRVEVAKARVSLPDGLILMGPIRVADPLDASRWLFTAQSCELGVAEGPLLAKQVAVTKACVSGIRFDAAADNLETAACDDASTARWFKDRAVEAASDRLAKIEVRLNEKFLDRLESVRRVNEFCERWPTAIAALGKRAESLESSAADLEKTVVAASANPLRNGQMLDDVSARADALYQDLECLTKEFEKLPEQLDAERRAIVAARRQDEEYVRGRLHVEAVDAKLLNAYLLRDEAARKLDTMFAWMRRLHQMAPADGRLPVVAKRGRDVLFAGLRPRADFLIGALELRGEARMAGGPVEVCGLATNLTTTPTIHGEPIQVRLSAKNGMPFELRATIDRTHGHMRDELFVECREMSLDARSLGQTGQLQLQVAPSTGSLTVSMIIDGDKLSGDIQLVQRQVRMTPALAGHRETLPLGESLDQSLGKLGSVATRLSLGGTIDEPACTLWSNLGPAVAEALQHGLQRHSEAHAEVALDEARRQVDERLTELDRQLADERERFARRAATMSGRIEAMARAQTARERLSVEQAGRRLPATSILR